MKNKIRNISILLALLFAFLVPVSAVAVTGQSSGSSTDSSQGSDEAKDVSEVQEEFDKREDRVNEFKKRFKIRLTLLETKRIQLKCKGAQSVVGKLQQKFGSKAKPRTEAYANLQERLDSLIIKLQTHEVDTSKLEEQITELKTKIEKFTNDLETYKQAIVDLKDVACKDDPAGFQAALEAARVAHDALKDDIKAIRTYLVGTIRPTLQSIKQQMEGQENKEKNDTDQSNETETEGSN